MTDRTVVVEDRATQATQVENEESPDSATRSDVRQGLTLLSLLERDGVTAILALIVVGVAFAFQTGLFLSATNISNLAVQIVPLALVGAAEAVVILMREIDLSLASIAGLTAAIAGVLLTYSGYSWWTVVLVALGCGAAMGAVQGAIVVVGRVPSFIVTLGGYLVFLGIQLKVLGVTGGVNIYETHMMQLTTYKVPSIAGLVSVCIVYAGWWVHRALGLRAAKRSSHQRIRWSEITAPLLVGAVAISGTLVLNRGGGIPLAFLLTLAIIAAISGFLRVTALGRHVYAVGGNPEAARRAGIRVNTIRWGGFVVGGSLAACAGLALLSYGQSASTTTGSGTLLLAGIGAAVIGGVSLFGGRGVVWGAMIGAVVIGGIENGLNLTGQAAQTKFIIQGVVVVAAVLLDSVLRGGSGLRMNAVSSLRVLVSGRHSKKAAHAVLSPLPGADEAGQRRR
jgi:D-xylose transport system permease protein